MDVVQSDPPSAPMASAPDNQQDGQDAATDDDDGKKAKPTNNGALQDRIRALGTPAFQNAGQPDPRATCPPATVVQDPNEFVNALIASAGKSGFGRGTLQTTPKDANAQVHWDQGLQSEADTQAHVEREFSRLQNDVGKSLNDYLGATSTYQERFSYISSATTNLQGMLADWSEARGIYEKADMAFALANLGVGGVKLGFKVFKWMTKASVVVETAAGAARATEAATGAARTLEGAAGATETAQAGMFAPIAKSGSAGAALRTSGVAAGLTNDAAGIARAHGQWYHQMSRMKSLLAKADREGSAVAAQRIRADIAELAKLEPVGAPPGMGQTQVVNTVLTPPTASAPFAPALPTTPALENAARAIDPAIANLAKAEGVDTSGILARLAPNAGEATEVANAEWEILEAVGKARGWHDMPSWAATATDNLLIQARKVLGGVQGAQINPQTLETMKSLKTFVESKGLNFSRYLETAAAETAVAKDTVDTTASLLEGKKVMEEEIYGIELFYDSADVKLINQVLEAGGDAAKLRAAVGPIEQISLNALAAGAAPSRLRVVGNACVDTSGLLINANRGAAVPAQIGKPTAQQLDNVMNGSGQLGRVGLSHVTDEFGMTGNMDKGYLRFMLGETWDLVTSPSTTVASGYYTWNALNELEQLNTRDATQLRQLAAAVDAASTALDNLRLALRRAGAGNPNSYLNKGGPDDLKKALDNLDRAFNSASPEWQRAHQSEMDDRRRHIQQKLADLSDAMKDLGALDGRTGQLRQWLDSVRLSPGGGVKSPIDAFNPETFVRLGSIALYLRGVGASAFGLTQDAPFHVAPLPVKAGPPASTVVKVAQENPPKVDGLANGEGVPAGHRHSDYERQPGQDEQDAKDDRAMEAFMRSIYRAERAERDTAAAKPPK